MHCHKRHLLSCNIGERSHLWLYLVVVLNDVGVAAVVVDDVVTEQV